MEIERKFFVKYMPDISGLPSATYERYILKDKDGVEERIQRKGDVYEYEIKKEVSALERTRDKKEISKERFDELKQNSKNSILRESYQLREKPNVSIKVYHGRFEGLIRAEVEFDSVDAAKAYVPESWMGEEITDSPIGKDSKLSAMSDAEFEGVLRGYRI